MSNETASQFVESVRRSGLVSEPDLATISQQILLDGTVPPKEVASKLVERNVLTAYQAEQLLAGRGGECVLAGRYLIRQQIGAGAMGAVYLADDRKLDRAVAIKVLPPQSVTDAGAVARFQREAKALAKLSHPNIIQAYDSDEDAGRQFLVMEYAEGTNLGELVRAKGRIAPELAADYVYQAALGLQNAHEKGLVHRDLKPGNLLFTPRGQVKILDLGLARFLQDQVGDATLTREGTGMGTPDYMAPEQFHDARHVDARSDIYSLGCTLYHLVAGRVPFPGTSMSEKYTAHEQQEPPPLQEFCPEVPAGLSLTVQRMMAKRPGDRFQSAREVAEALFPHVSDSSQAILHIKATASWHGSQLGLSVVPVRVRRRRRMLVGMAVAATASLVVALAFWAGGAVRPQASEATSNRNGVSDATSRPEPQPMEPDDPSVLTVAKDDSAEFQTINEALAKAKPGVTIRVLDDAAYSETLTITRPSSHARITIESTRKATIVFAGRAGIGLAIANVPGVTLRGFRIRTHEEGARGIVVSGKSPGVVLDRLEIAGVAAAGVHAIISLDGLDLADDDEPVVLRNSRIRSAGERAIRIFGCSNYTTPTRCARIRIENNQIEGALQGVLVLGLAEHVQIVGNQFTGCTLAGIQLENLLPPTQDILIANNTLFHCAWAFRVWDEAVRGGDVQFRNNLVLGLAQPDLVFLDSGGSPEQSRGPGDGKLLIQKWQFTHNWREVRPPTGTSEEERGWIPPAADDVRRDRIDVLSRDLDDPQFLRPASDSELATAGAGKQDPSLPSYVGAVPPEGVERWDWDKTWQSRRQSRSEESKQHP